MQVEEIKKLAEMARIDMSEEEMNGIAHDFEPILAYVGQVQEALKLAENQDFDLKENDYHLKNILREDVSNQDLRFSKDLIIEQFPDSQDNFLKVKQIL